MIFATVKRLIAEQFEITEDSVTPEMSLDDDLAADEPDMIELFMALEEEFDIESLENEDFSRFITVGDVVDFIKEKVD